jgi:predicted AlkP superfamily pyrophosphatase or phosphodiesterase
VPSIGAAPKKPKLVVAVVFDQLRYDYLTRFRSEYHAGFDRLLAKGAVFTNARYEHYPTITAVGHSTFLTGATPAISGIVGNSWFDRAEGKSVTSVSDSATKLVGATGQGASPRRMLVDTVGDELKMASGKSHVIGISLKDRAAILPAGHTADAAYWFVDPPAGS